MLNVKKTLTHLLNNLLYRTQRGFYNSATAITAGGYADYTITFPKAYDTVPTVVATLAVDSSSTSAENAKLEPFIISTSTSQVKIRVINSSSISRTPAFTWIAVGKIGGGYFLKAFTIFSRLAERWWEYAERKETAHGSTALVSSCRNADNAWTNNANKRWLLSVRVGRLLPSWCDSNNIYCGLLQRIQWYVFSAWLRDRQSAIYSGNTKRYNNQFKGNACIHNGIATTSERGWCCA